VDKWCFICVVTWYRLSLRRRRIYSRWRRDPFLKVPLPMGIFGSGSIIESSFASTRVACWSADSSCKDTIALGVSNTYLTLTFSFPSTTQSWSPTRTRPTSTYAWPSSAAIYTCSACSFAVVVCSTTRIWQWSRLFLCWLPRISLNRVPYKNAKAVQASRTWVRHARESSSLFNPLGIFPCILGWTADSVPSTSCLAVGGGRRRLSV